MPKMLFVLREPGADERRVPIENGLTIGRHPQCGCVLQDGTVSATHARILDVGGTLLVEDLGGTNSTLVDGRKLTEGETAALVAGTSLVFGQTRAEVVDAAPPQSAKGTTPESEETVVGGAAAPGGEATAVEAAPPPPPDPAPAPVPGPDTSAGDPPSSAPVVDEPRAPAAPPPARDDAIIASEVPESPAAPDGPDSGEQTMGTLAYGAEVDPDDPAQKLAFQAVLQKARPRLVFANEADRRVVLLEAARVVVGRSRSADVRLEHQAVSSKHAQVVHDPTSGRFFLEDLGGRNKTKLDGEQLAPEAPRELAPESSVHFGPIGALFVVDVDALNRPIPAERYVAALEVLVRDGKLQPHQRAAAESQAAAGEGHVGECLLLSDVIALEDWREAFRQGEALVRTGLHQARAGVDANWILIGLVLVVALALALVMLL